MEIEKQHFSIKSEGLPSKFGHKFMCETSVNYIIALLD